MQIQIHKKVYTLKSNEKIFWRIPISIVKPHDRIKADRSAFHVGAQFLTGRPRREAGEDIAESTLGRVGTGLRAAHSMQG